MAVHHTLEELQQTISDSIQYQLSNSVIQSICGREFYINNAQPIITTVAGNGVFGFTGDGGPATNAAMRDQDKIFVDHSGNLYIADGLYNNVVRKVDAITGIITTIAGNGTAGNAGNGGPATSA